MFDRLVFVEGPIDEKVLRIFASKIGVNFNHNNIGFIQMDGVGNFAHYAANKILDFLSQRQVKTWVIIDHDEKSEEDITKLQEKLRGRSEIKILSKRQIENYLISDRAIAGLIENKKNHRNETEKIDESSIRKEIDSQVEKLKDITVEKRVANGLCKPIYFDRDEIFKEEIDLKEKCNVIIGNHLQDFENRKKKIEEIIHAESSFINQNWTSKKFDLVPGDLLIDEVCKKYGVRYKKEKDTEKLAALMEPQEINIEIKQILHEICN